MARLWSSGAELNSTTSGVEFRSAQGTIDATTFRSGAYANRANPGPGFVTIDNYFSPTDVQAGYYIRTYLRIASAPTG